jgi:NAD(P)-dependent dehydrogenase (short-subunit alcohol dehydrogenase family)
MDLTKLSDGLAVLTGSASGLGYAMAEECCIQGMKVVVLSDLRPKALSSAVSKLSEIYSNTSVVGYVCDVTNETSIKNLLSLIVQNFPKIPIRFLSANAGVLFPKSTILSGIKEEWDTTYKVNVIGLALTLKTFVNYMLKQDVESCVEITASSAGVINGGTGPYGTSKHAALAIAEGLHGELFVRGLTNKIHLVVLCPAIVKTALRKTSLKVAEATRSVGSRGAVGSRIISMEARDEDASSVGAVMMFETNWSQGMSAKYCAKEVMNCLKNGKFYCILDNEVERDGFTIDINQRIGARAVAMLTGNFPQRTGGKL